MSLWDTRDQALASLQSSLQQEAEAIEVCFTLVDECIEEFEATDSPFARVCGLTLVKARNLALGIYSLMLDGLGQEAGALLRPMIEALELLVYVRLEPGGVEQAIEDKLPRAGAIAKTIEGEFKALRKHLNEHASHFGFTDESLMHVIDFGDFAWKTSQPHSEAVLRTNLGTLFLFQIQLAIESANCVSLVRTGVIHEFAERVESHRDKGLALFFGDREPQV